MKLTLVILINCCVLASLHGQESIEFTSSDTSLQTAFTRAKETALRYKGKLFENFHRKSVTDYITKWILYADSLLTRPAHPNAPVPFNDKDAFHRCRGLPSYSEGVPDIKMGVDLIASIYRGLLSYSSIL